ncbi:MAG TPA: hypothetical protein PK867_09835, partial [Pirellulales bacterium]|nr:hypothetical protein [Pirellulales bacterium]
MDETTLAIAEAVRQGEPVARLLVPEKLRASDPSVVAHWRANLQDDITIIKIELADDTVQRTVQQSLETEGRQLIVLGRKLLQKRVGDETLYVALDAFCKWVESKYSINGR